MGTATDAGHGVEGEDTKSPDAAGQALGTGPGWQGAFVPPRVTLTIELGTLTPNSVDAITKFVNGVLSAGPASAVGDASGRDVANAANVKVSAPEEPAKPKD